MNGIYKFERNFLGNNSIVVKKKTGHTSFKNHWHNYYEIMYYSGCRGKCILNGNEWSIDGECLFFLTPTDFHRIETEDSEAAYSINISFTENAADNVLLGLIGKTAQVVQSVPNSVSSLISEMYGAFAGRTTFREKRLYHMLNILLMDIYTYGEQVIRKAPEMHSVINNAIMYLITSEKRDFTLAELSKRYNLSESYFSHLFHCQTGVTVKRYINELKIEYAKRLLEDASMSILDICYEVGFNTTSHFIRVFKSATGKTPSEYRSEFKNRRNIQNDVYSDGKD